MNITEFSKVLKFKTFTDILLGYYRKHFLFSNFPHFTRNLKIAIIHTLHAPFILKTNLKTYLYFSTSLYLTLGCELLAE